VFISVVLPVYNERENLFRLVEKIECALNDRPREIVAVDDGSTDGSLEALRSMAGRHTGPLIREIFRCSSPLWRTRGWRRRASNDAPGFEVEPDPNSPRCP
jgi:glycosyltransferase involved in cell wall biosynthesis